MSKMDQIKALREARVARSNPFEDAARGRDPAPKKLPRGTDGEVGRRSVGNTAGQSIPSSARVEPNRETAAQEAVLGASKSKARSQAVRPSAHNRSTAGSNPTAPIKRPVGRPKVEGPRPWDEMGISRRTYYRSRETEK